MQQAYNINHLTGLVTINIDSIRIWHNGVVETVYKWTDNIFIPRVYVLFDTHSEYSETKLPSLFEELDPNLDDTPEPIELNTDMLEVDEDDDIFMGVDRNVKFTERELASTSWISPYTYYRKRGILTDWDMEGFSKAGDKLTADRDKIRKEMGL